MQKHRLISFLLAAVMVFGAVVFTGNVRADKETPITLEEAIKASAENLEEGGMSEEFESFIKFPKMRSRTAGNGKGRGLIPSVKELHTNYDELNRFGAMRANLPRKYDLRSTGRLTPIRDQGPNGSCWAFACYGALESYLRPRRYYDFSEKHQRNTHGFDFKPNDGGNREMSTAYMARWSGPVAEADDPYDPYDFYSTEDLPRRQDLIHALFLPGRRNKTDNDIIKRALMDTGAVSTIINGNDAYLNKRTAGFYDYSNSGANHAVVIVGWDDDYSRYNFNTTAPGNGAFIVRNSWGANWGDKGYYYVSYYDNNIGAQNTVYISEDMGKRSGIYQYDPLGYTDDIGFRKNDAWMANVFGPVQRDENIVSVSFYAPSNGAEYEIYINDNVNNSNPFARKKKVASGRVTYAGYHVIDFDGVRIRRGNTFAPIVYIKTPGYNRPIAVERPYNGFSSKARAYKGQSFISSDGNRYSDLTNDIANANVCVKAFTGRGGSTPTPDPDPEPTPTPDPPADGLKLVVEPEKAFYEPGETMVFEMQLTDKNNRGVAGATLEIKLETPNNQKYDLTRTTNSYGKAVLRARLAENAVSGKYYATVTAKKDGYEDVVTKAYATCRNNSGNNMHLNLQASKTQYSYGEKASFVAKVTNDEGKVLQYATVKFELKVNGKTEVSERKTDRYGKAYLTYYIPNDVNSGTGELLAEASANNWNGDTKTLNFKVIGNSTPDPEPNPEPEPEPEDPEEKSIVVEVKPNQESYKLGYSAFINIYSLYDGKALPNAKIDGTVIMPNGHEVKFSKTTNYYGRAYVKLGTKSNGIPGTYTIKAVISKDGFNTGEGQATIEYYR